MKKLYIHYKILFVSMLFCCSCSEYLDISPEDGVTAEEVYSDYYSFRAAVDRGNWLVMNYCSHPTNWGAIQGAISDEQQSMDDGNSSLDDMNKGLWLGSTYRDFGMVVPVDGNGVSNEDKYTAGAVYTRIAGKSLQAIRAMGLAIQNIENLKELPSESSYTKEELKNHLLGQAYALRAWHYFEVIRRYGPMMLVNTNGGGRGVFTPDFDFDTERPTWHQCADLMAADLDEAIKLLPNKYKDRTDVGRLTKASALAIKSKVYLYAASPLMNSGDESLSFGTDSYNPVYAKKGIEAMCACIDLVENQDTRYQLYPKERYMENWMSQAGAISDEALLQPITNNGANYSTPMNQGNQGYGWFQPAFDGGWATYNVPTQNAVDKFETIDGYPVTKFKSEDPAYDPAHPYENRDPRLKWFIFCPGDVMYISQPSKRPMKNEVWFNDLDGKDKDKFDIGYYYQNSGNVERCTGYYEAGKWRKIGYNNSDNNYGQNYYRYYPHIRLAEMYLGLAELANEVYGPTGAIPEANGLSVANAQDALNKIRNRVGMPNVRNEFIGKKEAFRDRVRNERAVEFYGEFQRWFDIKRWRIAKQVLSEGIYGAAVKQVSETEFEYAAKKLNVHRVFEDKHYWYPIDNTYIDMFVNFKQNPGW